MGGLIASLLDLYGWFIIAYVILSWFATTGPSGMMSDLHRVLGSICEPYVGLFRRLLPPVMLGSAGLDLSPLIALVVLQIVASVVRRLG
jgi:YggT family protein